MLSLVDQWLIVVVSWLADHSPPMVAGFLGGFLGALVHERWRARK